MTLQDKAELVARVVDSAILADANFIIQCHRISDAGYEVYREANGLDGDPKYAVESYGESILRYHQLGHISDDNIEELYMRAVLAGLHNKLEEQDDE